MMNFPLGVFPLVVPSPRLLSVFGLRYSIRPRVFIFSFVSLLNFLSAYTMRQPTFSRPYPCVSLSLSKGKEKIVMCLIMYDS